MLTSYIQDALRRAHYEILSDDGSFYGDVPGFEGVLANATTLAACREQLAEVLEEWILVVSHAASHCLSWMGFRFPLKKSSDACVWADQAAGST